MALRKYAAAVNCKIEPGLRRGNKEACSGRVSMCERFETPNAILLLKEQDNNLIAPDLNH
jgi:hypothetical protein